MKKILAILIFCSIISPCYSLDFSFFKNSEQRAVKKLLNSQVKWANQTNFNKFIATYDTKYHNTDGFNLDTYSSLVKDLWNTYDNIEYAIDIQKIEINDNKARVEVDETSFAEVYMTDAYPGELKSESKSIYYLEKINGKWKVVSDEVLDENTSILYGNAINLDVKLSVPNTTAANTDYTATLEFTPPKDSIAIASIASDVVQYPQKPTEEVFRAMPEDNILERIFTANNKNLNEYVVASIGLTQTSVCDLNNIKLSLTGFGYAIRRVNVIQASNEGIRGDLNVKAK